MTSQEPARAIDLYSGIGGWGLGIRMAGIEVAESYEWWPEANDTYRSNLAHKPQQLDIRALPLSDLPRGVDYVVGSPPCTQFSFANRGGNGDIADGLRDVYKFLEVVEHLSPRHWVMENVPRVAQILASECGKRRGRARVLLDQIESVVVVDMAEFGLPQRRRRMLAGSFPVELLMSYRERSTRVDLRDVLDALRCDPVFDPLYGIRLRRRFVTDDEVEELLNPEETRMNREAKQYHPVYNVMSFPDRTDRPSRTVTALCTRVSRESIVVRDERSRRGFRRLTLRERACLQGFPVTYQFHGRTYSSKVKMIGNAIPPLIAYYVGHAMLGTASENLPSPSDSSCAHPLPPELAAPTPPDRPARRFPLKRRFRAAVPNLRFGSGMRFDLANEFDGGVVYWTVRFYYGPSKRFQVVEPDHETLSRIMGSLSRSNADKALRLLDRIEGSDLSAEALQAAWTQRSASTGPFEVVDALGECASALNDLVSSDKRVNRMAVIHDELYLTGGSQVPDPRKLETNASWVVAGLMVAGRFNSSAPSSAKAAGLWDVVRA